MLKEWFENLKRDNNMSLTGPEKMRKIMTNPEIKKSIAHNSSEAIVMRRPATRGELIDLLKQNTECEIVTSNKETTNMFLDGWFDFRDKYKTYDSKNIGWTVYKAI
jgi:hypothetical protein